MTEDTLREHKGLALRLYLRAIDRMHGQLSIAETVGCRAMLLRRAWRRTPRLFPEEARRAEERYSRQPYRAEDGVHLSQARGHARGQRPGRGAPTTARAPDGYRDAGGFVADLRWCSAPARTRGPRLAEGGWAR